MAEPDVSRLTGADVTAAVGSFPRRFRRAFAWSPDEEVGLEELAARVGPDGRSAHDHLLDAVSTLVVVARALHQVVHEEAPLLHPAVLDPTHREWAPPAHLGVEDLLDLLQDEADGVVELLRDLRSRDWDRVGRVADGPQVTTLSLGREAVRTAASDLYGAERAMEAARRD